MTRRANSSWRRPLKGDAGAEHSYEAAVQKSIKITIKITIVCVIDKVDSMSKGWES